MLTNLSLYTAMLTNLSLYTAMLTNLSLYTAMLTNLSLYTAMYKLSTCICSYFFNLFIDVHKEYFYHKYAIVFMII
jgi:hypothetical protein